MEKVFAVDSVEEAIENLKGRNEPWAQVALQNIGGFLWSALLYRVAFFSHAFATNEYLLGERHVPIRHRLLCGPRVFAELYLFDD